MPERPCTAEGCDRPARHRFPRYGGSWCTEHSPVPVPPPDPSASAAVAAGRDSLRTAEQTPLRQAQHTPVAPVTHGEPTGPAQARAALQRARQERDAAVQQVEQNADEAWRDAARRAVWWCANTLSEFTADDVWERLEEQGVPGPREPRALGPVMVRAVKARAVEDTGRMAQSRRRHAARIPIYRLRERAE